MKKSVESVECGGPSSDDRATARGQRAEQSKDGMRRATRTRLGVEERKEKGILHATWQILRLRTE